MANSLLKIMVRNGHQPIKNGGWTSRVYRFQEERLGGTHNWETLFLFFLPWEKLGNHGELEEYAG